mgnify:CR=1 FL=1
MGVCAVGGWLVRWMWLGMLANKGRVPSAIEYEYGKWNMGYGTDSDSVDG